MQRSARSLPPRWTPELYAAELDCAWSDHLAPREPDALSVVSTFAGCGGSSLGYSMSGYHERAAVEFDPHAALTFRANFPDVPVIERDIREISGAELLAAAQLEVGALDVLDGSPPCQGFSTAGARRVHDTRNDLAFEFARLLVELQPRAFVMENVSGLVKGKMRLIFVEILRALKAAGYRVSCRLMNAQWYGVPQSRERTIFVGFRNDLDIEPSHPAPIAGAIPLKDAVPGLLATTVLHAGFKKTWRTAEEIAPTMTARGGAAGGGRIDVLVGDYTGVYSFVEPGKNAGHVLGGGYGNCIKPDANRPSPTLVATNNGSSWGVVVHPRERRPLNIDEAKLICSFPAQFELTGSFAKQWARLGNAVPPLFMRAISAHVRDQLA